MNKENPDQESLFKFQYLFNHMTDGVVYQDSSGQITDANSAALEMLGLSMEQIQGRTSLDPRWHAIHPDGSDFPGETHPAIIALREGKSVENVQMGVFNPATNSYRWILISANPIFIEGEDKPNQVFASFKDITKQILAEKRLKQETKLHEILVHVSTAFINLAEEDVNHVIQSSLETLGKFVEADRMYIFDYDWENRTTSNTFEWCAEGIEPQIEYLQNFSMEGMEDWAAAHQKGEQTYIEDVSKLDPKDVYRQALEPQGIQSLLTLPIMIKEECIGFIGVDSVKKVHHYSEDEFSVLRIFSGILSNVRGRLTTERNEKERTKELRAIYEVTTLSNDHAISESTLLQNCCDTIKRGFLNPEKTQVKIKFEEQAFYSSNFEQLPKSTFTEIEIDSRNKLRIDVFIPEGSKFLNEEYDLLKSISTTLKQSLESKEGLRKLKSNEKRLQSLFDSQKNYIIRTDLEGRHTFWNKKFADDFGYLYPHGLGKAESLASICAHDQAKATEYAIKCIENPGVAFTVELDKPTKNGEVIQTLWDFVCLTDSQGIPFEIQCEGIDISDMRRAEKTLKESEEKYRFLFEESPDGYLIIEEGRFIECNKAALDLIRYSKKELLGKYPYELSPEFQPNGRNSKEYSLELLYEAFKKGLVLFEWVHTRQTGEEFLAEIKLSKVMMDGREVLFTTWKDITEQRNIERALEISEERFSQIAEHSGAVTWEVDETGLYTYMSPVCKKIFGYDPQEIINKKYFYDLFPEHSRERYKTLANEYLTNKENLLNFENPIQKKNGEIIWVSTFATPVLNDQGELVGYRGTDNDITSRKHAEEELKKFRIISDQASYGTVITIPDGRIITYCNKAFADMHGYQIDELIGRPIDILHTPEQFEFYIQTIFPKYLKNKEYALEEFGRKRKDGSTFLGLVNVKLFTDEEGNPLFNAASVIDITERKQQEELIQEQNRRLSAIIDSIPDNLYVIDREGNYLELLNTPKSEPKNVFLDAVGKNIRDLFNDQNITIHLEKIKEAFNSEKVITYEYKGIQSNPDLFYEARLVRLSNDRMLRLIREITDRKLAEQEIQKLNLAINQSPAAVIITDKKGHLQYMSPAFLKMTGFEYEELIGQPIGKIKSGQTDRRVYQDLWETINAGKTWRYEWQNRRKNGELYWEDIAINPIRNEEGDIISFMAIKQDITQRKKYEEEIIELNINLENRIHERTFELELAKKEADEANSAKSEFLSRMSHELRTPMNSILGFAQLLEYSELTEAQLRNLEFIIKSGNHLLHLINEVLDITRIESGKVDVSLEPVDVIGAISEISESFEPIAEKNHIQLILPSTGVRNIFVQADLQRLKQVLVNLINNGIKYNKPYGKVKVSVSTDTAKVQTPGHVRIEIKDTGIGIEAKNLNKLFMPFERAGHENSTIEGTGLGLSVVDKLIELMNGKIGVESTLGIGSTFWIELPQAVHAEFNQEVFSTTLETDENSAVWSGKVLMVEDNQTNLELISELVQTIDPNFELIHTKFGEEVLSLAEVHRPNLILLDLHLPDMHGSEVLKRLKSGSETNKIPVVVVSADASPKTTETLLSLGAEEYVTKPINVSQMIKLIRRYTKGGSND
ncbi:PAS domain S-box protein [Algoriphagus sanaruensis]|uniref:histidine kinase n=1 Tax=Algoriphagus sanaruensis TaxID=1727163 RepID=A0A142EMY8_9BACT|nr:PAS domain S-box protein [Algoriphagus sanaruensis]AMQ56493.1 hypothetical protein AO498_08695 [Algoriphagus sanaruensis]